MYKNSYMNSSTRNGLLERNHHTEIFAQYEIQNARFMVGRLDQGRRCCSLWTLPNHGQAGKENEIGIEAWIHCHFQCFYYTWMETGTFMTGM